MHNDNIIRTKKSIQEDLVSKALDYEFKYKDIYAKTITFRKFFEILLTTLWDDAESFSGKSPFGNSDWEYRLYETLVSGGFIVGKIDEYGDVYDYDEVKAHKFVVAMIKKVFEK